MIIFLSYVHYISGTPLIALLHIIHRINNEKKVNKGFPPHFPDIAKKDHISLAILGIFLFNCSNHCIF